MSNQIMSPNMAQNKFDSIYYGTCKSLGNLSSPTGHQDLHPINAQITRIWAKLHNAATWLIQTKSIRTQRIDLYGYRTESEPMLWFDFRLTWWGSQNQVQVLHGTHQC